MLALVGALAVTAGCTGVIGQDGATATPDGTDAAATPTESGASPTDSRETATARTATATAASGGPNFLDEHIARLRAAGNVTVRTTTEQTVSDSDQSVTQTQSREVWIDFERGRVRSEFEPLAGNGRERYRNDSGATFTRLGGDSFLGPGRSDELGTETYAGVVTGDADAIERTGTGTVDGVSGTVYTVDSLDAAEAYSNLDPENVSAFELTYVVADAGHVSYQRVNLTYAAEGRTVSYSSRRRFVDVGSTTVREPDWLSEARAVAARPDPDDLVTRTYETTGEGGRIELEVTAPHSELEGSGDRYDPDINENPRLRYEGLNDYRVGEIANYYYPAETAESVTIRVHYDDDAVADRNESDIGLYTRNRTDLTFEPVNSTLDAANDTVSVTLSTDAALENCQGRVFIALRWPEEAEWFGRGDSDGPRREPRVGPDGKSAEFRPPNVCPRK